LRFVTFQENRDPEPGVLFGGQVIGIRRAGFESVASVIAGGADALDRVARWLQRPPASELPDMARIRLLAPIRHPPKIICIGLNYRDHAAESKMTIPEVPTVFAKFSTSIIGPGDPIVLPKNSTKPDYEAEFVVVIGKRGATTYSATACSTTSARGIFRWPPASGQWARLSIRSRPSARLSSPPTKCPIRITWPSR
jgi:2-keto-4-pentenoate hydratase/2-oxohepta-3-ene-1,7-dioic acid hydratase in catechol pathway